MDDDDQETGIVGEDGTHTPTPAPTTPSKPPKKTADEPAAATATTDEPAAQVESETAPPKPPRPMTETQKNELTLKEAFPSVEPNVIRAVLSASGGHVEPAFNALLGMSYQIGKAIE